MDTHRSHQCIETQIYNQVLFLFPSKNNIKNQNTKQRKHVFEDVLKLQISRKRSRHAIGIICVSNGLHLRQTACLLFLIFYVFMLFLDGNKNKTWLYICVSMHWCDRWVCIEPRFYLPASPKIRWHFCGPATCAMGRDFWFDWILIGYRHCIDFVWLMCPYVLWCEQMMTVWDQEASTNPPSMGGHQRQCISDQPKTIDV